MALALVTVVGTAKANALAMKVSMASAVKAARKASFALSLVTPMYQLAPLHALVATQLASFVSARPTQTAQR